MDTIGIATIVATLDALTAAHGNRFAPTDQLRAMASSRATFYSPLRQQEAA
jgi:3-hydroxyacyl-CoA dehydrogenase/enoyl-CoA hydratase/3-hydroxybutyryl-CoA epimerase